MLNRMMGHFANAETLAIRLSLVVLNEPLYEVQDQAVGSDGLTVHDERVILVSSLLFAVT
jgi:hypothetical protein